MSQQHAAARGGSGIPLHAAGLAAGLAASHATSPMAVQAVSNSAGPSPDAAGFDPKLLWVTLRRCWFWAIPAGLVMMVLAGVAVFARFVPSYRSSHLLEANQDYVVFKGVMPSVNNLVRTEKPLLLNPIVLDPVLADPSLRRAPSLSDPKRAEANLRENLRIESAGSPTQLLVTYTDTDREMAAEVCNAVVAAYLRQRDAFDSTRISNLQRWLEPEIERWQSEVSSRQLRVQSLSQQTLGYSPGASVSEADNANSLQLFTRLRSEIAELEVSLAIWDATDAMDKNAAAKLSNSTIAANGPASRPAAPIVSKPVVLPQDVRNAAMRQPDVVAALDKVRHFERLRQKMEDDDLARINRPYYRELSQKRAAAKRFADRKLQRAIEQTEVQLREQADQAYAAKLASAKANAKLQAVADAKQMRAAALQLRRRAAEDRQSEKQSMIARLDVLKKQYESERQRLEQFGGASAELQFAKSELEVAGEVLQKLRSRVAAIRTERRQDGAVRSLAAATPSRTPIENMPTKQIGLAGGAALLLPFALGLLWELKTARITDATTLEKNAALAPIVGELARAPMGDRDHRGRRVFEESVETMRANLFLSAATRGSRTFAICSSMSGEGKSTSAAQLAISIAKATAKTVLLIDGDVRRPEMHEVFGLPQSPGLTDVLSDDSPLDDAINRDLGDVVHVLPAGQLRCSPHGLLGREAIDQLVQKALETYDFVVIDTAPVLAAGETLSVASVVDATLLCAMRDKTRMDSLERTSHRLQAAGANVVGTVFSGVSPRQYAYRYGDYRYAEAAPAIAAA